MGFVLVQEQTITGIGIALHIGCVFVIGSVWRACGNAFPYQLKPMDEFSIAARSPLFNGQVIVYDVIVGSARSALATVLLEQWLAERLQAHRSSTWPSQPSQMFASTLTNSGWP